MLDSVAACRSSAVVAAWSRVCFTSCWVMVEPPSITSPATRLRTSARAVPSRSTPWCS